MTLDTKSILNKLGEIEEQEVANKATLQTMDDRINELAAHFGEKGQFIEAQEAIKLLEQNEKKRAQDLEQVKRLANRMTYSEAGVRNYRGIWQSEEQSRQFGLLAMTLSGNKKAEEVFKRDYADLHERIMTTDDDSAGGGFVTTEFYNRILFWAEEYGVFFRKAQRWPMGGPDGVFPKVTNNITVYCPSEGSVPTQSDLTTGTVGLSSKTWHTLTYYSKNLSADSAVAVGELIGRMIARAYAQKADEIGFLGDGTSTYFNETGVIPALTTAGKIIEFAGDDTHAEVDQDDIDNLMSDIPQYADAMAEFYGHRKSVFNILMRLARSAGGVTAAEIEGRRRLMHGGYPVNITQVMSSAQTDETPSLLFGSLQDCALWGDHQSLQVGTSSEYKFGEGLVTVLSTLRTCIKVVNTDAMRIGSLETTA